MNNKFKTLHAIFFFVLFTSILQSCSKEGCTQSCADNYDSNATKDDGSCFRTIYPSVKVADDCTGTNTKEYEISETTYNELISQYFQPGGDPCPTATFTTVSGQTVTGVLRWISGGSSKTGQVGC